eukprot:Lankesteria_metandrocarpae@DN2445_c0_g1_i1.p1
MSVVWEENGEAVDSRSVEGNNPPVVFFGSQLLDHHSVHEATYGEHVVKEKVIPTVTCTIDVLNSRRSSCDDDDDYDVPTDVRWPLEVLAKRLCVTESLKSLDEGLHCEVLLENHRRRRVILKLAFQRRDPCFLVETPCVSAPRVFRLNSKEGAHANRKSLVEYAMTTPLLADGSKLVDAKHFLFMSFKFPDSPTLFVFSNDNAKRRVLDCIALMQTLDDVHASL